MTRVLYILFAFFFIIGNCLADVGVCDDPNTTLGETGHNCAAGKYWDSTALAGQGDCMDCPEGYYCPRQSNQNNGVAYCCPPPFTATQSAGVQNVKGCYIKIDTCIDGHQVVGIPEYPMDAVYIGCGENWSNRTCNAGFNTFTAQRAYSIHNEIYTRAAYENIHLGGLTDVDTFFDEGYHLEIQQSFSASPTHDYGGNVYPISFDIICVPNSMPCDTFRNFTDYEEAGETFDIDNSTHVAQFNTALGAPPEDVELTSFITIPGTNCPVGSTINNNAIWDDDQNKWDVHECRCVNSDAHELDGKNCFGFGTQVPDTSKNVRTIQENVIYNTELDDTDSYCIRCKQDTTTTKYFVADKSLHYAGYDSTTKKVSACQAASANSSNVEYRRKGRYRVPLRPNYCNSDTNWVNGSNPPGVNLDANPCPRVACTAVGTTTNELLPIKGSSTPISQICVYGSGTQICDAIECKPLQDVDSLPLSGWEMLP